ncbi:MAG: RDD family protein, partial [Candidatus Acidiferrales bacterium]
AQNGPVIQICSQCGALLLEPAENCTFCDAPLVASDETSEPVPVGVSARADSPADNSISVEPEWRLEVSRRLEAYRVRRGRYRPDDSQSGLPFSPSAASASPDYGSPTEELELTERPRARVAQRVIPRKSQNERVEITIQPELDFSSFPDDRAHPQTALVPVADLAERRRAGALDALFLALTYAGFLGLFRSLGGQVVMEKVDAVVYLSACYLFYAQYFFLFTTFAGATPGMQLRGITIVRLDGSLPDTRQLLWRSFGYLLSGATMMLGFLWSLWDEDHFTWQDRISQTYITAATPLMEMGAFEVNPASRRLAHK